MRHLNTHKGHRTTVKDPSKLKIHMHMGEKALKIELSVDLLQDYRIKTIYNTTPNQNHKMHPGQN